MERGGKKEGKPKAKRVRYLLGEGERLLALLQVVLSK